MLRFALIALLAVSAEAFSPSVMASSSSSLRLRSTSAASRMTMMDRSEFNTLSKAALTAVVAGSLFGLPTLPADASINSQMSMNTDSFSVLKDNQKTYTQTSRAVNPYASKEEQMAQLEMLARLEECQKKNTVSACEEEEANRARTMAREATEQRRSPLTFAVPIVVTTALSGVLIKILNR